MRIDKITFMAPEMFFGRFQGFFEGRKEAKSERELKKIMGKLFMKERERE
jgi:hypothetical protein